MLRWSDLENVWTVADRLEHREAGSDLVSISFAAA